MIAATAASTSTHGHHGVPPPSSLAAAVVVGDSIDGASVAGGGGSVAGGALVSRWGRVTDGPVLSASPVGGSVLGTKVTDGAESPPPGAEVGGLVAEDGSVPEPPPELPHAPRSTAALTRAASRGMTMAHTCRLLVRRRAVRTTGDSRQAGALDAAERGRPAVPEHPVEHLAGCGRVTGVRDHVDAVVVATARVSLWRSRHKAVGCEGIPTKSSKVKNVNVSRLVRAHKDHLRAVTLR